ncbi:MAG: thermonuclease family protein [Cellulosilyticaceae bacterium]
MLTDSYNRHALVTYIVDGDTFDAQVDLGFHVFIQQRFRILGINAPELKGATKIAGNAAKDYLASLILNKQVMIHSIKTDGFRRYLADIYVTIDDQQYSVAQLMLSHNYAVPY